MLMSSLARLYELNLRICVGSRRLTLVFELSRTYLAGWSQKREVKGQAGALSMKKLDFPDQEKEGNDRICTW